MKIALFVYDFPHFRSCDFLLRMVLGGFAPDVVIGAPWKQLHTQASRVHVQYDHVEPLRAYDICRKLCIKYVTAEHDGGYEHGCDLGVIGGARILRPSTIRSFSRGILNMHPGHIPDNRGLDNIVYAVWKDIPQYVTAHFIDGRVDAGRVISRTIVPLKDDDSIVDAGTRVFEALGSQLVPTLKAIAAGERGVPVGRDIPSANVPGVSQVDAYAVRWWSDYRSKWA